MQEVIDQLNAGDLLYDRDEEPPMLANLKREFPPIGAGSLAAFAGKIGYEYFWHKVRLPTVTRSQRPPPQQAN